MLIGWGCSADQPRGAVWQVELSVVSRTVFCALVAIYMVRLPDAGRDLRGHVTEFGAILLQ